MALADLIINGDFNKRKKEEEQQEQIQGQQSYSIADSIIDGTFNQPMQTVNQPTIQQVEQTVQQPVVKQEQPKEQKVDEDKKFSFSIDNPSAKTPEERQLEKQNELYANRRGTMSGNTSGQLGKMGKDEASTGEKLGYVAKSGGAGLLSGITGLVDAPLQDIQEGAEYAKDKSAVENVLGATVGNVIDSNGLLHSVSEIGDIWKDNDKAWYEKLIDTGLTILSNNPISRAAKGVGQLIGTADEDAANKVKAVRKIMETPSNVTKSNIAEERQKLGDVGEGWDLAADVTQSIGNMLPSIAASAVTSNPNIGLAVMGASAKGQATSEAEEKGADIHTANKVGWGKGATEVATEKLTGGLIPFGSGVTDDIVESGINKMFAGKVTNFLAKKGMDIVGEEAEEVISDLVGTAIDRATIDPNAEYTWDDLKKTLLTTAITTGTLNAGYDAYGRITTGKSAFQLNTEELEEVLKNKQVEETVNRRVEELKTPDMSNEQVEELKQNVQTIVLSEIQENVNDIFENGIQQVEQPTQTPLNTLNQGVLQENNQTPYQIQTPQITPLNQVNQELQETRQNDIANQVQAMNLEQEPEFTQKQGNYVYEKSDNSKIDNLRKDAANYLKEGEQTTNFVNTLEKLVKDKDIEIRFDTKLGNNVNGTYKDGVITINPNSNRAGEFVAIHELTHAIGTQPMIDMIQKYRNSNAEFNSAVERLLSTYNTTEINEEALGDIAGQLFGNQEYINNLSKEQPSLFKRIYNEIKYLWHQFRGYKNQNQFIEDLRNKWESAYRNQEVQQKAKNSNIEMSNQTDSNGNMLSNEQVDYFKNSKIRDENGNLIPMYHGTPNGDFTVFNPGSYFSPNQNYANNYQDENASILKQNKGTTNKKTYQVYLNIENPFELNNPKARDIYINEFIKGGNSGYFDPYTSYSDYVRQFSDNDGFEWLEAEELKEWIQENHPEFDGLVVQEVPDNVDPDAINLAYIPFNSNQIKNIDNLTPTKSDDIRYSQEELDNSSFSLQKKYDDIKNQREELRQKNLELKQQRNDIISTIPNYSMFKKYNETSSIDEQIDKNHQKSLELYEEQKQLEKQLEEAKQQEKQKKIDEVNKRATPFKDKQFKIIQKSNPMLDDYHTGIRQPGEIRTWTEAMYDAEKYGEGYSWGDFTKADAEKALKNKSITIYSSYPIKNGVFVTPSRIQAEQYAGGEGSRVYSKTVRPDKVAWINVDEGQYADAGINTYEAKYSKDNQTWREYLEKEFPSQGTRTNLQDINERNKPLTKEEKTELDGLKAIYDMGLANEEETARYNELERRNKIKETAKTLNLEKETKPKYSINENAKDDYVSMKIDKAIQKNAYKNVNTATKTAENYLKFTREQKTDFKDSIKKLSLKTREQLVNGKTYNQIKDLVNNYANVEYNFIDEELKNIKSEIRKTKINIPEEVRNQITDYSDFRKQSKLNISKDGQNIDSVWQELSNDYPHIFDSSIQTEADMLYTLSDLMNKDIKVTEKYRIPDSDLQLATKKIYNSLLDNSMSQIELDNIEKDLQLKAERRTRQVVQNELLKQMDITLDDIESGKDIKSVNYQITDPRRVNEKVFSPKVAQKINDATVNFVSEQEAKSNRWKNKERDEIKDLGIKARSKESAAVQKYGEKEWINNKGELLKYGDEELAREFPNKQTQEKIKNAAKVLREKYDNYIDKINVSLEEMGYDPIPKRKDYFKHFYEVTDKLSQWGVPFNLNDMNSDLLPTDINGLTDEFKPGKNWFASAQQRTGKKTVYDAITGIDQYLEGASNLIFHTESIQRYRTLSKFVRDTYGQMHGLDNVANLSEEQIQKRIDDIQNNKLSGYAAWLDEQANALAGKKGKIDRGVEEVAGRRIYKALNTLKSQVGSNMTGFNVRSAMTNFASAVQGASKVKKTAFLKGTLSTIQNIIHKDGLIDKSNFLTNRFGSDSLSKKAWQKATNAGQIFMTGTDYFTANQIWRSKYFENMSKGMTEKQAIKSADDFAARIMGDRSKGQTASMFNSKTLGFLTQFQLEVNNQWQSMIHDNKMDIKTGAKSGGAVIFQLGQLAVMSNLFNLMMKSLTGSDVMFDPIDILKDMIGGDDDDKDITERAREALGKVVDQLPMASVFTGGGRIPISEAFKGIETTGKYLIGGTNKYGQKITGEDVKKDLLEALPYWIMPTGWGQARKTKQGIEMYTGDKPVAGSYTDKGNLRFTADTTPLGKTKAALFGQYSSQEAQDYIKSGFKTITAGNNLEELKNLGYTSTEYKKYRQELNAAGTKNQDKMDYILSLDIPKKEKDIMASRLLRKEVDTDEIKNFETLDDFNKWYKKTYGSQKK